MLTIRRVLEQLTEEGHASARNLLTLAREPVSTPWYARVPVVVGAWFAAIFLVLFLLVVRVVTHPESAIISALVLVAASGALNRLTSRQFLFSRQLALALMFAGQGLLLFGLEEWNENLTGWGLIGLNALVIIFYHHALQRLISMLLLILGVVMLLLDAEFTHGAHGLIILLTVGCAFIWTQDHRLPWLAHTELLHPLAYGMFLGLESLLLPSVMPEQDMIQDGWLISAALGVIWGVMLCLLLERQGRACFTPFGLLCFLAIALPALLTWQTPGLSASLLFLLIGFQRRELPLMGLSLVFLAWFLSAYYYYLEIDLLYKSLVLMASGGCLLAIYGIFRSRPPVSADAVNRKSDPVPD